MTPGQTRVLVLLAVLFTLEAYRQPAVKNFVIGIHNNFLTGLSNASKPAGST